MIVDRTTDPNPPFRRRDDDWLVRPEERRPYQRSFWRPADSGGDKRDKRSRTNAAISRSAGAMTKAVETVRAGPFQRSERQG